jgi:hypothetical protein
MDEGEVVASPPVEAGGEAAELLKLVEAAPNAIAQPADYGIVQDQGLARAGRGNNGLGPDLR